MKLFLVCLSVLIVSACNYELAEKKQPREVPKPYVEREVLSHQGGAFNSCPPDHRAKGRC